MRKEFSIFDDAECHCGGKCCGGQTDPAQWDIWPSTLGAIEPASILNCVTGTPFTDPNGVGHCLPDPVPTCRTGEHPQGNYAGEWICAPDSCPPGQHMGYSTDGRRVICASNDPAPAATTCPPGYRLNPVTGSCIRSAPAGIPGGTPGVVPASGMSGDGTILGLSPLMLLAIAGGGIFLLSSMGGKGK